MAVPAHRSAAPRRHQRRRPVRLITAGRLCGAALIALAWLGYDRLMSAPELMVEPSSVTVVGRRQAKADEARAALALGSQPRNVLLLRPSQMERALLSLPTVGAAQVNVTLPNHVAVSISEREPLFALRRPAGVWLVDAEGVLFHQLPAGTAPAGLPELVDARSGSELPAAVGDSVDPVDMAATARLLAITPAMVGSADERLSLAVDDADGFVLRATPAGWRAVFGFYTPTLRQVDIIPRQVECLRALLAAEPDASVIYLEPNADRCGTYRPRTTPSPAPSA